MIFIATNFFLRADGIVPILCGLTSCLMVSLMMGISKTCEEGKHGTCERVALILGGIFALAGVTGIIGGAVGFIITIWNT